MDKLYVYADFNWLDKPMLVGELGFESIRGSQSYSFKYSPGWLNRHASIILSEDIRNYQTDSTGPMTVDAFITHRL